MIVVVSRGIRWASTVGIVLALVLVASGCSDHDDEAGTIAEGKRADIAVLDRNPFAGDVHDIAETRVTTTIASGDVVFEA